LAVGIATEVGFFDRLAELTPLCGHYHDRGAVAKNFGDAPHHLDGVVLDSN
jgi:hypothetical protein